MQQKCNEMLEMTIEEAHRSLLHPHLKPLFEAAVECGIGYLNLGRRTDTLSGGELRRIKLARQLSQCYRRKKQLAGADTLIILDSPAAALHPVDTQSLINGLLSLRAHDTTILCASNDPALLNVADKTIHLDAVPTRYTDEG